MKKLIFALFLLLVIISPLAAGDPEVICEVRPILNKDLKRELVKLAEFYRDKGKIDWAVKIENYATGWTSGAVFRSPEGSLVVTFSSELDTLTDRVNIRFFDERIGWYFREIPILMVDRSKDMAFAQLSSKVPIGLGVLTLDVPVQKYRNLNLEELGNDLKIIASTLDNRHLTQELKPHLNLGEVSLRKDHPVSPGDSIFSLLVTSSWVETLAGLENSQPKNGYELKKIWENKSNIITHFKGSEGEVYFTWAWQAGRWTLLSVLNSSGPDIEKPSERFFSAEFGPTALFIRDFEIIGGGARFDFTVLYGRNGYWFGLGAQLDFGFARPLPERTWGGFLIGPHFRFQWELFPESVVSPLVYLDAGGSFDFFTLVKSTVLLALNQKILDERGNAQLLSSLNAKADIKIGLGINFSSPEQYPTGGSMIFETGLYGASGYTSGSFGGWLAGLKWMQRF